MKITPKDMEKVKAGLPTDCEVEFDPGAIHGMFHVTHPTNGFVTVGCTGGVRIAQPGYSARVHQSELGAVTLPSGRGWTVSCLAEIRRILEIP